MTREDAIKIFNTVLLFGKCDCPKEEIAECLKMAIKALKQEPKTGHRACKDLFGSGYCSECNNYLNYYDNYCPNCGAKMESEAEDGNDA